MTKTKRRRVSREEVRKNARDAGSGPSWFNLPAGMEAWAPEKAGTYLLDIVPYEVKTDSHPDGVDKGVLWYKFPFMVHRNVGPNGDAVICPVSVGKRCPMCEDRAKLKKQGFDDHKDEIKALTPQKFVAYNILHPDDKDKMALFAMSRGKFAVALEKELDEGDDTNLSFYDVTDDGRTLKVRFSDAEFEGRKYLEATRIDFVEREAMDEDDVLGRAAVLEEIFNVMSYEKLKALYLQVDEEEEAGEGGEEKPAEEEKPADEEPTATEEKPTFKKGDKVQFKDGKKTITGNISKIKGDDVVVTDDDGDDHETTLDDLEPAEEAQGNGDTPPADEPVTFEEGDDVTWKEDDEEKEGTVVKVKSDGTKVQVDCDGEKLWVMTADLEKKEAKPAASKGGKGGAAAPPAAKSSKDAGKEKKCPKGHKWGEADKHGQDCEKCGVWDSCEEAS